MLNTNNPTDQNSIQGHNTEIYQSNQILNSDQTPQNRGDLELSVLPDTGNIKKNHLLPSTNNPNLDQAKASKNLAWAGFLGSTTSMILSCALASHFFILKTITAFPLVAIFASTIGLVIGSSINLVTKINNFSNLNTQNNINPAPELSSSLVLSTQSEGQAVVLDDNTTSQAPGALTDNASNQDQGAFNENASNQYSGDDSNEREYSYHYSDIDQFPSQSYMHQRLIDTHRLNQDPSHPPRNHISEIVDSPSSPETVSQVDLTSSLEIVSQVDLPSSLETEDQVGSPSSQETEDQDVSHIFSRPDPYPITSDHLGEVTIKSQPAPLQSSSEVDNQIQPADPRSIDLPDHHVRYPTPTRTTRLSGPDKVIVISSKPVPFASLGQPENGINP